MAALIDSLDLFITVSNTTAHLAGALNITTFVKIKNIRIMKKLNYLLISIIMFAFIACGGGENKSESSSFKK